MNAELEAKIAAISYWYHRIALPGGVVTPGWAPISAEKYGIPERLDGLRVLDIGAWDGYWTFEALRRGAREVVAIDDFSDHLDFGVRRRAWETFDLCRDAFGYGDDRVTRREMSVYDISPETLGTFDTVFFFGTLYHLRHPLLALDKIAGVCTGEVYVETAIIDDFSPYRGEMGDGYDGNQMVLEFYPDAQFADNATNWWAPTLMCLLHMVRVAGFTDVTAWKLTDAPTEIYSCRGFAKGTRTKSQNNAVA